MEQVVQVAAALMVLAAFVGSQYRMVGTHSFAYLVPNLVGSGVLAEQAVERVQWGFVVLEGTWAAVSVIAVARRLAGHR